jgi:hypothetical protein
MNKHIVSLVVGTTTLLASAAAHAQSAPAPAPAAPPPAQAAPSGVVLARTTPQPPRETVTLYEKVQPNRALLYTGGVLFLGSYVPTAAITATRLDDTAADRALYLPIVGPWLHLADANEDTVDTMLVAGSGVLQGVGAGLMLASLFVPQKIPAATIQAGDVKMNVAATTFGKGSAGVGAAGTF